MNDEALDFKIEGGRKLRGTINTNFSKNGALGLICASLLNKSKTTLHGIPKIEEVFRLLEVLKSLDVSVSWVKSQTLEIKPPKKFNMKGINNKSAGRIRSILMLLGPLIHMEHKFLIPHAGGCKMGNRTIEAHRHGFEALGTKIKTTENFYEVSVGNLRAQDIVMYESSATATE